MSESWKAKMTDQTKAKVDRNLAGIQFLMSRPDVQGLRPCTEVLDNTEHSPAFHVCRSIMRDNVSVISVSLRVNIITFGAGGNEQYTHRDFHGRGTTFEMALFDLSAHIIRNLGDNDWIDTESLPIVENYKKGGHSDPRICANEPNTVEHDFDGAHGNEQEGVETRGDNPGRSGKDAGGYSERGRKGPDGHSRHKRSQRSG